MERTLLFGLALRSKEPESGTRLDGNWFMLDLQCKEDQ